MCQLLRLVFSPFSLSKCQIHSTLLYLSSHQIAFVCIVHTSETATHSNIDAGVRKDGHFSTPNHACTCTLCFELSANVCVFPL